MHFVPNAGRVDWPAKPPPIPVEDEKRLPIGLIVFVIALLDGALWAGIAALVFWLI
jgi:hypothetical protein